LPLTIRFFYFFIAHVLITALPVSAETVPFSIGDTIVQKKQASSFLNEKVHYLATDSIQVDMQQKKAFLYNHAEVYYQDLILKAGFIEIDFGNDLVYAYGIKDSTGKETQKPVFEQGPEKFTAGKITYNIKTKKGKINDVITQQNDGYIHGSDIKKDTGNIYYVANGKFTTCDLEHPHFYIGAKKIKVIPNDKIITGPAELYIADIPTPLAIPFGFFPNKKGRASGILIPSYGESNLLGFFLKDGGFYFGGSEKFDLALRGDIYANGSFGANALTNYRKRYKYSGSANVRYSRIIEGGLEIPKSTYRNDFFVRWYHSQDEKSKPGTRFSADVNAGSSTYNRYNGSATGDYLTNTFQSNISYSKTIANSPFNFSANARHNQNTQTKLVNVSLPELALNMNRIYPFKSKNAIGVKWHDKIGLSANVNARNDISAYDSVFFTNKTLREMKNGVRVSVPIATSLNVLKYFTLTPAINTSSNIYFRTYNKRFDADTKTLVTDTITGIKTANEFSTSAGLSTRLYGDYFFRAKKLKQIRHVAIPTLSVSYRPDFSESQFGYYRNVVIDTLGTLRQYAIFENAIYGSPAAGRSALLSFSLNNTFEAKTKTMSDSGAVFSKHTLLDNFGVAFSYNAAVKTYNWSNISLAARTKLFKHLDLNSFASLDPYQINDDAVRIEKFEWNKGRIGRLTSASVAVSTSLRSKEKKTKPAEAKNATDDEMDYINTHRDAYVDFDAPWNLNVYYNLNYIKPGYTATFTQSISFNGDISITPKWKLSATSGYDFTTKKITLTSVNVYRDLHCWEMRFNWVPFGFRQSFSIDINVKSATLRDLKLSRKKDWYDYK
jgi:LptD protein